MAWKTGRFIIYVGYISQNRSAVGIPGLQRQIISPRCIMMALPAFVAVFTKYRANVLWIRRKFNNAIGVDDEYIDDIFKAPTSLTMVCVNAVSCVSIWDLNPALSTLSSSVTFFIDSRVNASF